MPAPLDHRYSAYGNALRVRFNAEVCKRRPQPRIFTSLKVKGFPIIPAFGDVAVRARVTYQEPSFPRSTRMDHGGATALYNVRYRAPQFVFQDKRKHDQTTSGARPKSSNSLSQAFPPFVDFA